MERLTKRDKDGNAVAFNYIKTAGEFKEIVDRLAEYEDLEEQGLIVRLPCKVGDKVYILWTYDKKNFCISDAYYELAMLQPCGYEVYCTREEAEKRLKELMGEGK